MQLAGFVEHATEQVAAMYDAPAVLEEPANRRLAVAFDELALAI